MKMRQWKCHNDCTESYIDSITFNGFEIEGSEAPPVTFVIMMTICSAGSEIESLDMLTFTVFICPPLGIAFNSYKWSQGIPLDWPLRTNLIQFMKSKMIAYANKARLRLLMNLIASAQWWYIYSHKCNSHP